MRVFLRLFHPLPHPLDAHDVLNVDPEHVGARHRHVQRRRAAAPRRRRWTFCHILAPRPPLHDVLRHPTTPYQSRPGHPPRCPPSFPRFPRPERSAPSRACSRRDATRPCMPSATASRAWAVAQPSRLSIGRLPRRRRRRLARRERRAWCGGFGNPPATLRTVIRQLHAHDWPTIASFTSSAACRCSCAGIAPPAFHPRSPRAAPVAQSDCDVFTGREIGDAGKPNVARNVAIGALLKPPRSRRTSRSTVAIGAPS